MESRRKAFCRLATASIAMSGDESNTKVDDIAGLHLAGKNETVPHRMNATKYEEICCGTSTSPIRAPN